jgi:hypothetical protein
MLRVQQVFTWRRAQKNVQQFDFCQNQNTKSKSISCDFSIAYAQSIDPFEQILTETTRKPDYVVATMQNEQRKFIFANFLHVI